MRRLAIVATLLLVPVAAACGGPSAGGLAGKSAEQVIQLAQAAAKQKGSFHFVDQTGTGSDAQILTGDVSGTDTEEQVKGPNGTLDVRLEGSTIYVQASTLVLENALKLPASVASSEAGKWISLLTTDVPYQTAAKALEPTAEVAPYIPAGDLKIGSVTTLRGENVLAVSGTASTAAQGQAVATMYVSTTAPFVPVGASLAGTGAQKSESEVVAFTAWGETVHPAVPAGAIAYSSLKSS